MPLLTGCISREIRDEVRFKHAEMYVFVDRLNSNDQTRHPTQQQEEDMLRANLKDFESYDRILNGWNPTVILPEVNINGKPGNIP